jgi:hypothetical protein
MPELHAAGNSCDSAMREPGKLRGPADTRRRIDRLIGKRDDRVTESQRLASRFDNLNTYLAIADKVTVALEKLSEQLFQELLSVVQEKLTIALQEILDQPIQFRAQADFKRGAATVEFWIEHNGNREDVLRGQGGSVANVLSVGLRMFALATLDVREHRRFLVSDEQDCWLRPDLVPKLAKIVHEAAKALGFQILMISHHDVTLFERYADRIYQFGMNVDGTVEVRQLSMPATEPDSAD